MSKTSHKRVLEISVTISDEHSELVQTVLQRAAAELGYEGKLDLEVKPAPHATHASYKIKTTYLQ